VSSTTLNVSGMTCGHCRDKVERALKGVPGVYGAEVDLTSGTAQVETSDEVRPDTLIDAVQRAGYRSAVAA